MISNTEAGAIGQRLVDGARALYADLTEQLRRCAGAAETSTI